MSLIHLRPFFLFVCFCFILFCLSRITFAGWTAQKTTCSSTVNPFIQGDSWEEWNWDTGGEYCFVCAKLLAKSIAQKSTSGQSASSAQLGPDPRNPVLPSVPSVHPSSEHFLHAVGVHETIPAPLARFVWGKAFYRMCLYMLLPR